MKLKKISHLLLLLTSGCFVLLSGCGAANNSGSSAIADGHRPTSTSTVRSATSTSTTRATDCPATGTMRAVNMPAETSTAQPAVFYLTLWGGVQSGLNPLNLIRYDLTTGKATTILTFSGFAVGNLPMVHLSPDKHWLLIMNGNDTAHISSVQLMRTDGTQLQTLTCSSSNFGLSADWLPDGKQVAITRDRYDQQQNAEVYTVEAFNLATGKAQTVLSGDYAPYVWLDDHRLVVEKITTNTNTPDKTDFFLFDTNNGSHQKLTNLTHIASFATWGTLLYGDVAVSSDSSQLFISSFNQAKTNPANCRGATSQGPGTLNAYVIKGGSTPTIHTIYSNQGHAILTMQPVSSQTLLMYIENNIGDQSQNGLWKINTDGTGLTRLTTANDPQCRDLNYREWAPQIVSNGQSYAFVQTDFFSTGEILSIVLGKLSGGTPTTIATSAHVSPKAGFEGFLQLVGMA